MRRRTFLQALPVLSAALLPACAKGSITVASHPWIGYESLFFAREFGWLPAGVTLAETASAVESIALLRSGEAAGACLTLDEALRARSEGVPVVVVAVLDVSAGADAIMARPGIRSVADLAGKLVGVESSAVGELLLSRALESAGMKRSDVRTADLPIDTHHEAWMSGKYDAIVSYEPTSSRLAASGAVRVFDSRQVPGAIVDVLVVHRDRLAAQRRLVGQLLRAHFRGLDHLRVNRQDAIFRAAARQKVPPEAVSSALAGVVIPDIVRNRAFLAPGSELHRTAAELLNLMAERRMLASRPDIGDLFDGRHLPEEG